MAKTNEKKRVRGKAKVRNPDKPRRPRSAYNFYASEHYQKVRAQIAKTNPDAKATTVISTIAKMWKGLNAAKKKKYLKLAADARKVHEKAMDVFKANEKERKKKNRELAKRDKTRPKRPMSAYLYFGKDKRPAVKKKLGKDSSVTDVMGELAQQWAKLSTAQKSKYQQQADAAKEIYDAEIQKWKDRQQVALHAQWKNKWKKARRQEVEAYKRETKSMTGAQLLNLKGEDARDIKRPKKK